MKELTIEETKNIDGGWWQAVAAGIAIADFAYDFYRGFEDGYAEATK